VCSEGQRGVRLLERCALEKVVGIGGMFFRAENPEVLREWYADNLGVVDSPGGAWLQEEGPTVFAPFSRDTGYFGSQDQQFMVNFRVRDLGALLSQLREAGVEVVREEEAQGVGRFAWIVDPEGNRVELWEPEPGDT
jgi:catechol 2,3-dioxygenase-like lactoylglutathione lyase family enzyme